LVKVLGIEGNRIKLSRKAILREQRAKMAPADGGGGGGEGHGRSEPADGGALAGAPHHAPSGEETITFEGGGDFPDEEPNFNREEANRETVSTTSGRPERPRGDRGGDRPRHGGSGGRRPRRGGGGGRGPGGDRGGHRGGGDRGPR